MRRHCDDQLRRQDRDKFLVPKMSRAVSNVLLGLRWNNSVINVGSRDVTVHNRDISYINICLVQQQNAMNDDIRAVTAPTSVVSELVSSTCRWLQLTSEQLTHSWIHSSHMLIHSSLALMQPASSCRAIQSLTGLLCPALVAKLRVNSRCRGRRIRKTGQFC